ncbi:LamG domain-containing protein [Candidatus Poribacteria bacterium]|nr:LamG domain-containing protein [Candidatus Poribacteria bacterium]
MKANIINNIYVFTILLILITSPIYGSNVDKAELVFYYSFDADTITNEDVIDQSENGNDGFIHGSNLNNIEGKVNDGMEFPGVGTEYISVRKVHYTEGIPELTIAVWIKTAQRGMIASWDRSEYFRFAAGDAVLDNTTFVAFDICCPIADWHGKIKVTDDEWHHVAVTFNAEMRRIYVDGKLDVEAPTETTNKMIGPKAKRFGFIGVGSEADVFNGNAAPTGWAFKGLMDEFLYFHRSLSEDEIKHLANAPEEPFDVDPKYKLSSIWANIKTYY